MCLASVEILFNIPIAAYGLSLQARAPLNPYISWENVHEDFSRVELIPSLIWQNNYYMKIALEVPRWAVVFCAFLFFLFFGFADEARKNYRYAFQSVAKRVGLSTASSTTYVNGINSLDYGFEGCVFIIILFREGFSRWLDNLNIQKEIENRQFIRESSSYSSRIRSQRDASTSRFYELLQQHVNWRR